MRLRKIAATLAATLAGGFILFAGPGAANAADAAEQAAVVDEQHHVVQFQTKFTPEQAAQLDALTAKGSLPSASGSDVGILWQGGFDRDHWWVKISKTELISIGAAVVCRAVLGAISWFACPPIVAALNWALSMWPNAGGYWAELYTNGTVRAGTW